LEIKKSEFDNTALSKSGVSIIEPCFIDKEVILENCTVGPHVSIGMKSTIKNSTISNSIIQTNCNIENTSFTNSLIGNHVSIKGNCNELSIGDYSTLN
jgi:glucose-1-phosphate thymidylyltransferase